MDAHDVDPDYAAWLASRAQPDPSSPPSAQPAQPSAPTVASLEGYLPLTLAGRMLGYSRQRAWELLRAGRLAGAVRVGKRWKVPASTVRALLASAERAETQSE